MMLATTAHHGRLPPIGLQLRPGFLPTATTFSGSQPQAGAAFKFQPIRGWITSRCGGPEPSIWPGHKVERALSAIVAIGGTKEAGSSGLL